MTASHAALLRQVSADATDRDLLGRFAAGRDESAFAELVRRHGPLVLAVCLRTAGHRQDAEDAFQAVFLTLARKAAAVRRPDAIAGWLYGVAYRVARRARRSAARRRVREVQVAHPPDPPAPAPAPSDVGPVLDAELAGLPEWYRDAVVLCDLQGLPRPEAAAKLGIPEGTLSSRLAAGRRKLADRLARRGVALPTAGLATFGTAEVSADLTRRTVAAATDGAVPATIELLTSDGGAAMGKVLGVTTVVIGLAVGAVAAWPGPNPDDPPKPMAAGPDKPADKPDPPAPGGKAGPTRPRLVTTLELSGTSGPPIWTSNGTALVVRQSNGVVVYDGRDLQPFTRVQPSGGWEGNVVGVTRGRHPMVVTHKTGSGRINAVAELRFWTLSLEAGLPGDGRPVGLVTVSQPTKVVPLEPDDGFPAAVLGDGKAVLAVRYYTRPVPPEKRPDRGFGGPGQRSAPEEVVAVRYRVIDAATGEAGPDVVRVPVPGQIHHHSFAVTPAGDRLFVAGQAGKAVAVECYALPAGAKVWGRTIDPVGPAATYAPYKLTLSGDGKLLAVTHLRIIDDEEPAPPKGFGGPFGQPSGPRAVPRVVLLDPATGQDGPKLADLGAGAADGLSHDGRFLVVLSEVDEKRTLQVWDTRSGKMVKSWAGAAETSFAPDRLTLAILETIRDGRESRSVLGLWDLSGLAK